MSGREKLEEANAAMSMAAIILASVAPTLKQFVRSSRTVLPEENRATLALLRPLAEAALTFSNTYKAQLRAAAGALENAQVGKIRTGRQLDGSTHNSMPEVRQ